MNSNSERRRNETPQQMQEDLGVVFSFISGRRASKPVVIEAQILLCKKRDKKSLDALVKIIEDTGVVPFALECVLFRLSKAHELLKHEDSWHELWR